MPSINITLSALLRTHRASRHRQGRRRNRCTLSLAVSMTKHREGQLAEAEQMHRQVLRWQPDQPDAYHLLGLLAAQLNQPDDALPLFERAITLNPIVPEYHANYANAENGSKSCRR